MRTGCAGLGGVNLELLLHDPRAEGMWSHEESSEGKTRGRSSRLEKHASPCWVIAVPTGGGSFPKHNSVKEALAGTTWSWGMGMGVLGASVESIS